MLAVILTKSFRCLCFTLKCTYPYFSVYYLKSVFGTAGVWTAYKLFAVKGAFPKGTEVKRRHWTYAKRKDFFFITITRFKEQRTTSLCCRRYAVLLFVVQASVDCKEEEKSEEEKKWGFNQKVMFF